MMNGVLRSPRPRLPDSSTMANLRWSSLLARAIAMRHSSFGSRSTLVDDWVGEACYSHRAQLPSTLPPSVDHFDYVPLTEVLPRAAALVHHGGIGSAAQAPAAGIPHLVRPMAFDQPDNADRLSELGVARILPPVRFRAKAVTRHLEQLLGSAAVAARCRVMAKRLHNVDALSKACDIVEAVGREDFPVHDGAQPIGSTVTGRVQ